GPPPQAATIRQMSAGAASTDRTAPTTNLRAGACGPCVRSGSSGCLRAGTADRAPERASNDVDDLLHVAIGLAALCGGADTALHMVLQNEHRQRIDRRPERAGL